MFDPPFLFTYNLFAIPWLICYSLDTMVVRMRHNRSQVRQRRSHHALTAATVATCSNCGASRRPHHMCLSCGFYNGRQVIDLASENKKRTTRMSAKKEQIRGTQGKKAEEMVGEPKAETT